MLSRNLTVADELGLHARPAARIAVNAERANSNVWIIAGNHQADAKSMINILMLGCRKGAVVTIRVDDPRDAGILERIALLIEEPSSSDNVKKH